MSTQQEDVVVVPRPMGVDCDWCKKSITQTQILIKCRRLNCASSYKLHLSCVTLAQAAGTEVVCSICRAPVSIANNWQRKLVEAILSGIVPQLVLDQIAPRQMSKFDNMDTFSWLFVRILISFFVTFMVVVSWYFFCWFSHAIHLLGRGGLRVLKR